MSFKVLVIPEDPTQNGYILKPLVQAILADAGKPAARVVVLPNPRLRGYDHALRAIREELPDSYSFWDLWIFIPDADRATALAMKQLEGDSERRGIRLLCCPAEPEVEIYACAAYQSEIQADWSGVRRNSRFKEDVFAKLLRSHGDDRRPGRGRDLMIAESLKNLPRLFKLCPELKDLRDRVEKIVHAG